MKWPLSFSVKTGQAIEKSGLAGPVRTDQAIDLAPPNGQRNIMQGLDAAEMLGNRVSLKKNCCSLIVNPHSRQVRGVVATRATDPPDGSA
jgi:hypothetical protein